MAVELCETKNELRNINHMFAGVTEQVSICKEYGGKGTGIGFGEFLLYEGEIDEYELESALNYQKEGHVALGVLAVQEKYLSGRQLCDILDYQRVAGGGLFGEIAIELGFLNKDDVNVLLKMQNEKHIRIGEVLVLFGAISRENMESELKCFHELV